MKSILLTIVFSLGCLTATAGEPATFGLGETVLAPVATYGLVQQTTCKDGFCLLPNRTRTKTVTTIAPVMMAAPVEACCVQAPVIVAQPVCCEPATVVMAPVQCVAAPVCNTCQAGPAMETLTRTRTRTRRVRKHRIFGRANTAVPYTSGGYGISSDGLAQQKAQTMANGGIRGHVDRGNMGGYAAEGVGFSSRSAQDAIQNVCFWGERTPAEIGVAQGNDGMYYSTVLFH